MYLSISNTAIALLGSVIVAVLLLGLLLRQLRLIPDRCQLMAESYYLFIRHLTLGNIQGHGERYVPALFTLGTSINRHFEVSILLVVISARLFSMSIGGILLRQAFWVT